MFVPKLVIAQHLNRGKVLNSASTVTAVVTPKGLRSVRPVVTHMIAVTLVTFRRTEKRGYI